MRESRPLTENEDWSDSSDADSPALSRRGWMRLAWAGAAIAVVVLLVTLPPLVNVNRYQRRVAQAISGAIGRPVHFDTISMHLLPLPGFTIQNFVVQEDPDFGTEPAMRANVVQARVRFASLWRRRIEISRIRLESPSVNLVRRADGRWNLQGVVMQASQLDSSPTSQPVHSAAPRFPYVEATDARINLKQGDDKLPYSLIDAKFALWLPNQNEWRLRLEGRPLRTDTDVSDVGDLRIEGTLGRNGQAGGQPKLDLSARLSSTPMGEAAKLVLGNDTGWRGAASAELLVHGTPGTLVLTTDVHLHNLRRADFVPRLPMSVDAHCEAEALGGFHQVHAIRCAVPTAQSTSLLDVTHLFQNKEERVIAAPDVLAITAEIPDTTAPHTAVAEITLERGSPEWALGWLRLFSTRLPAEEQVGGLLSLHARLNGAGLHWEGQALCRCELPPANTALERGTKMAAATRKTAAWRIAFTHAEDAGSSQNADVIAVSGLPVPNDGTPVADDIAFTLSTQSAPPAVFGQLSRSGYSLQYTSADFARYAASLLPPLGDALPKGLTGAVQSERKWGDSQAWTVAAAAPPAHKARHHAGWR